jgi:hypothetical protein
MSTDFSIVKTPRIVVDPNSASRLHPDWSVALFDAADRVPNVGDKVFAVQPDIDGSNYVGNAVVKRVDDEHRLIYLVADWTSFSDEFPPPPVQQEFGFDRAVSAVGAFSFQLVA